nr:replication protein A 70 kDa DNA-binding subunit A-like [Quercus suber]
MPHFLLLFWKTDTNSEKFQIIQIQVNMEYTTLKQISRDKDNSKVKVRVLRMWDAINIANNHDLINLDMVLVDTEGTLIHASIRKNLAQTYRPQLNEGSIYTITNFLVEEDKGNYQLVHNKLKILFNSTTSVSKFNGFDDSIPQSQFEFADYGTIASRCFDTTYLTENDEAKKYTTMDINVKEILPKGLSKVQDTELALHDKKTIAEIKDLEWNSATKDLLVTCNAKIININNKYGWYYVACLICKTKVKQVRGVLWCERCKNEPKFAVPSYRIQVQAQDETSSTTFILFDKGAEKIIAKTAKELAEKQEEYGKENYMVSKILEMEILEIEEHQDTMEEIIRFRIFCITCAYRGAECNICCCFCHVYKLDEECGQWKLEKSLDD